MRLDTCYMLAMLRAEADGNGSFVFDHNQVRDILKKTTFDFSGLLFVLNVLFRVNSLVVQSTSDIAVTAPAAVQVMAQSPVFWLKADTVNRRERVSLSHSLI